MMFGKFVKGSMYCDALPPFTPNILFSESQIYPIKLTVESYKITVEVGRHH